MKKYNITQILFLTTVVFVVSSCSLNINVDPNNPSTATFAQLLPVTQVRIANSFGQGSIGLSEGAGVYMHQNVQRSSYNQYNPTGGDFSIENAWVESYTALKDLQTIIDGATTSGQTRYSGIAKILKAYTFSMMVDAWGDVPYSEANKGAALLYPKFDGGASIYTSLFTLIDDGIADLAKTNQGLAPAGDDVIYAGSAVKWRQFAKTLKLKMYNNERLVVDVKAQVNALITEGDLITNTGDFEMPYGTSNSPENRNPGYLDDYPNGRANYISPYFYEILTNQNTFKHGNTILAGVVDPRVPYYFFDQKKKGAAAENPSEYVNDVGSPGRFISIFFDSIGKNQGFDQSSSETLPGLYPYGGKYDDGSAGKVGTASGKGNVALRMLPYFNSLYIQAELALAGLTTGDARALLQAAVNASFAKVNAIATSAGVPVIPAATITTYLTGMLKNYDAADANGKLEMVLTEKWIANYGFGLESYNDYRRTGYPKIYDPKTDDTSAYNAVAGGGDITQQQRDYPVSLPWRSIDLTVNPNSPKTQKNITTFKVFWMK